MAFVDGKAVETDVVDLIGFVSIKACKFEGRR